MKGPWTRLEPGMLPGTLCLREPLPAHSQGQKSPPASQRERHTQESVPGHGRVVALSLQSPSPSSPAEGQFHLSQVCNWCSGSDAGGVSPNPRACTSPPRCAQDGSGTWKIPSFTQFHPWEDELCTHTLQEHISPLEPNIAAPADSE